MGSILRGELRLLQLMSEMSLVVDEDKEEVFGEGGNFTQACVAEETDWNVALVRIAPK